VKWCWLCFPYAVRNKKVHKGIATLEGGEGNLNQKGISICKRRGRGISPVFTQTRLPKSLARRGGLKGEGARYEPGRRGGGGGVPAAWKMVYKHAIAGSKVTALAKSNGRKEK